MHCDVTRYATCIANKIDYLDKEDNYKNSTTEVIRKHRCFQRRASVCDL